MKVVSSKIDKQQNLTGHVVNIPTELKPICTVLPRVLDEEQLTHVEIKRNITFTNSYVKDHVNVKKVYEALEWLKANNPFYADITINRDWSLNDVDANVNRIDIDPEKYVQLKEDYTHCTFNWKKFEMKTKEPAVRKLRSHVQEKGFIPKMMKIDNNLLFRCFKYLKKGNKCTLTELRTICADALEENTLRYQDRSIQDFQEFQSALPLEKDCLKLKHFEKLEDILHLKDDVEKRKKYSLFISEQLENGMWPNLICLLILALKFNTNMKIVTSQGEDDIHVNPNTHRYISLCTVGEYIFLPLLKTKQAIPEELESVDDSKKEEFGFPTCIQSDETDLCNKSIIIAPGQTGKPTNVLTDTDFEPNAVPWIFCTGKYHLNDKNRAIPIRPRCYYSRQLMHYKNYFSSDSDYIFTAQYAIESSQLINDLQIALRRLNGTFNGERVNAKFARDPEKIQLLLRNNEAYRFMKNIRGTSAFWSGVHFDALAMLKQLSVPTWFMTLSAAEAHWPELLKILGKENGRDLTDHMINNMTWEEKCDMIRENPTTVTRHFEHKVRTFFREVMLKTDKCPCGKVDDYFYRVEFQMRGSPHLHCLIWHLDSPKYEDDDDNALRNYIDEHQSCHLPTKEEDHAFRELVLSRQKHKHNGNCLDFNGKCRYSFPHFPLKETMIVRSILQNPEPDTAKFEEMREKMVTIVTQKPDIEWSDFLNELELTYEEYRQMIFDNSDDKEIRIKRQITEVWINYYNPKILKIWKSNMDFQYVCDAYACIVYITSYMMKAEKKISQTLKVMINANKEEDIENQMKICKRTYQDIREIGIQDSLFRILSLHLKSFSRRIVFVNSQLRKHRNGILKDKEILDAMEDEATDIYKPNLLDRYPLRPDDKENMCLADFAAQYEFTENEPKEGEWFKLKGEFSGYMRKLKQVSVIRSFKNSIHKKTDKFIQNLLILYTPWRNEEIFDVDIPQLVQLYKENEREINLNQSRYEKISQTELEKAMDVFNSYYDRILPTDEHMDQDLSLEQNMDEEDTDNNLEVEIKRTESPRKKRKHVPTNVPGYKFKPHVLDCNEYKKKYKLLNFKQQYLIDYCRNWCLQAYHHRKRGLALPDPYNIFLHAAAGCGKSFCISLILHDIYSILGKLPLIEEKDILALVTAYTGTAAYNVHGMTINTALSIPTKGLKTYTPLSKPKLDALKSVLGKLQFLIIDEISLVNPFLLRYIHKRLQQIKGNNLPFGGVNVIVVGDIMQLAPVRSNPIYQPMKPRYRGDEPDIWSTCFKKFELTEVMRQAGGIFKDILLRIRTGNQTPEDLKILQSRVISKLDDSYPIHTLHVFATRDEVTAHNKYVTELEASKGNDVFIIHSKYNSTEHGVMNYTESTLTLNCPVFITINIDIPEGLVNGTLGYVRHFVKNDSNEVDTLLLEFNDDNIGKKYKGKHLWRNEFPNCVPLIRQEQYDQSRNQALNIVVPDIHFPILPGWATTIHKVQGMTLDQIVVSMKGHLLQNRKFQMGQAYVAFSRVRKLEDLFIIDYDPTKIVANDLAMKGIADMPGFTHDLYASNWNDYNVGLGIINMRGIATNLQHLSFWIHNRIKNYPNFIIATETKCQRDSYEHEVYNVHVPANVFTVRENFNVALLSHKNLGSQVRNYPLDMEGFYSSFGLWEVNDVDDKGDDVKYFLLGVYRNVRDNLTTFACILKKILDDSARDIGDFPTVVAGDFNSDIDGQTRNIIFDMMTGRQFEWLPTSFTTQYGSCLDHCYVRNMKKVSDVRTFDCFYSDHLGLLMSFKV